jgi:hypothetical protein
MAPLTHTLILLLPALARAALPSHDWSVVPRFFHGCNFSSGRFSPAAASLIARRFASATIEKGMGVFSAENATVHAEAHMLAAAQQLKALNASLPVIAYFNAFLNW